MKPVLPLLIFVFTVHSYLYCQVFEVNSQFKLPSETYAGSLVADINNDSFPDIFYADKFEVNLYVNQGTGKFDFKKQLLLKDQSYGKKIQLWDLDKDGDLDLLLGVAGRILKFDNVSNGQNVQFERADKDFFYYGTQTSKVPEFIVDYINQDTLYDLVLAYNKTKILFQRPDSTFFNYEIPSANYTDVQKIAVIDLDTDGKNDLVFCRKGGGNEPGLLYFLNSNNNFSFQRTILNDTIADFELVDFDDDGKNEILTTAVDGSNNLLYIHNVDTVFTTEIVSTSFEYPVNSITSGELNGQPGLEFVLGFDSIASLQIMQNLGAIPTDWDIKNLPSSSFISRNIFIEDLDKDGDDDIVQMLSDDGFLIFERIRITNTENINFEVNVYPNPADENLNVDADQVYGMKIIDVSGKVMYSQPNIESQTVLVPVKDFKTGMYFIELITKDNNINRRPILIMH
ncbi:MAG TPA: FG-GAP-like repeat-containing protein [Saprospiraceae bacterium]|jgi:hypothetical protein|nr:FG-GAP-like repeat-containing protein [Saprospiraceae bacterium]